MEAELGIPVLRHSEKKPAGGAQDLEAHFGCKESPELSPCLSNWHIPEVSSLMRVIVALALGLLRLLRAHGTIGLGLMS